MISSVKKTKTKAGCCSINYLTIIRAQIKKVFVIWIGNLLVIIYEGENENYTVHIKGKILRPPPHPLKTHPKISGGLLNIFNPPPLHIK